MTTTPTVYWSAIGPQPSPPVYVILGPTVTQHVQHTPDPDEHLRRAILSLAKHGTLYFPQSKEDILAYFRSCADVGRAYLHTGETLEAGERAANDRAEPHTEAEVIANMRAWIDRMQAIAESVGVDVQFSVGRLGKQPERPQ